MVASRPERLRRVLFIEGSETSICETCSGPGPLVVFDTGDYARVCATSLQRRRRYWKKVTER